MNAARVIHGIATFMLLGVAFLMLRQFGEAYKYGHIGEEYREIEKALRLNENTLPWLSAIILPLTPISWWSALTPLFWAIGVAVRVPAASPVSLAVHWLIIVIMVSIVVMGSFFAYVKITSVMGSPLILPPTPLEIGVNVFLLVVSGAWMALGIRHTKRG